MVLKFSNWSTKIILKIRTVQGFVIVKFHVHFSCIWEREIHDISILFLLIKYSLKKPQFQCCGNTNYTDFENYAQNWNRLVNYTDTTTNNVTTITARVPIMCCKTSSSSTFPSDIRFENLEECLVNATSTTTNHAVSVQFSIVMHI